MAEVRQGLLEAAREDARTQARDERTQRLAEMEREVPVARASSVCLLFQTSRQCSYDTWVLYAYTCP